MPTARVTITLPDEVVNEIDRLERNRSRFIVEAVRHELDRRRRAALATSLSHPHADSLQVAEAGFADWANGLPAEDVLELVDPDAGVAVEWSPDEGWSEKSE